MDENRPRYSLKAPGASDSPRRLPGRGSFPGVDDRLVEPEVTRDEIIGGHRMTASPAERPHATQHSRLDYVLQAHAAPGYEVAADLLTRHDQESDFATDVCVFKEDADPVTGGRHLEELAFEIVSEQGDHSVTEKAVRMQRRGVRRIFAVWVKGVRRVCEWSAEDRGWWPLESGGHIEDPSLVAPLAVAALLDAAAADHAVVAALVAKGDPTIRQRESEAKSQGVAESVLKVLEARGIALSAAQRQEILNCRVPNRLDRWLRRASTASSAAEITSEP
jgi:hypothetical protein